MTHLTTDFVPESHVRRTPQGWQCPVCNKVHAPWVASCDCHKRQAVNAPTDTFTWPPEPASAK